MIITYCQDKTVTKDILSVEAKNIQANRQTEKKTRQAENVIDNLKIKYTDRKERKSAV